MSAKSEARIRARLLLSRFLAERKERGATSEAWRKYHKEHIGDVDHEALLAEMADGVWRERPRDTGPDLFSIHGLCVAEYLTRPAEDYELTGEVIENETFEKVDARYATISDGYADATIKMRKAAQSSTAAEKKMRQMDVALKRARGDRSAYLRDISDEKVGKKKKPRGGQNETRIHP